MPINARSVWRPCAPWLWMLAALCGAQRAWAEDLDALLARYREWRGGAPYADLKTVRLQGRLRISSMEGTFESIETAGGAAYQRIEFGAWRQMKAAADGEGWVKTASGQIEALSADAAEDMRREALLAFPGLLEGRAGARLRLLPDERYDGARWRVVRIEFGDRDGFDLLLDARSGAEHGYRKLQNNETTFVRESDWRRIDGVRIPCLIETIAASPEESSTLKVTDVRLNEAPPADWLRRPAVTSKASFAQDARRTAWMPFEFPGGRTIYIAGDVNGTPTRLLLDSGAQMTALDRDFAAAAGIKAAGSVAALGAGGTDTAALATGVEIRLGDLTLKELTVATLPLAGLSVAAGKPLTAILGKELWNEVIVDLDFERRRIAFERREGFRPAPDMQLIGLTPNKEGMGTVEVRIEGGPRVPAVFDLGNEGALVLNASYWKPREFTRDRRHTLGAVGGVGGTSVVPQIVVRSLEVGDTQMLGVPADLAAEGRSTFQSDRTLANVGIAVWSRFRLLIDAAGGRLYLAPYADSLRTPFQKDRSGLALLRKADGLTVQAVAELSPAQRAGWRVGDRITTVNGADATASASRDWRYLPAGTRVALGGIDASGKIFARSLKLEDFY